MGYKVRYKKDGIPYVYEYDSLATMSRAAPEPATGPFSRCEGCGFSGHGFVCWEGEDSCLRIKMGQIMARERRKAKCISTR